jgi:S1-C subfamily serine protease
VPDRRSRLKLIVIGVAVVGGATLFLALPQGPTTLQGPVGIVAEPPTHGLLGVELDPEPKGAGLVVKEVLPGSAAERAGLRGGDRLLAVDAFAVAKARDVREIVKEKRPGQLVRLKIQRGGGALTLDVPLISYDETLRLRERAKAR